MNPHTAFEREIFGSFRMQPINPKFQQRLEAELEALSSRPNAQPKLRVHAWQFAAAALILLAFVFLGIGPQRVYAQLRQWLGYVDGAGLIDRSVPLRVLKEPVSQTRDGVIVKVEEGVLSADGTWLRYHIFGLPQAEELNPSSSICTEQAYLQLPDGTKISGVKNRFEPLPLEVGRASLILPCLPSAVRGQAPEDWDLPLEFTAAPENFAISEVIWLDATQEAELVQPLSTPNFGTLLTAGHAEIVFERVIRTDQTYILDGLIRPLDGQSGSIRIISVPIIRDASGNLIVYKTPEGLRETVFEQLTDGSLRFAFELPRTQISFPVTLEIPIKLVPDGILDQSQIPGYTAAISWVPADAEPAEPIQLAGLCVQNESFDQASSISQEIQGHVYWLDDAGLLYRSALDGSQTEALVQGGLIAATADGSRLAWVDQNGLTILTEGKTQVYPQLQPYQILWSADGSRLAMALDPNWPQRVVLYPDTGEQQSFDALSQEELLGFSTDGNIIYLRIPGAMGEGSLVMSFDLKDHSYKELFYLDHRGAKGPQPVLSPDGEWIAYLGKPQGTLLVQHVSGAEAQLVVDAPGEMQDASAISKLVWASNNWLAFNFYVSAAGPQSTWLLDPSSCAFYELPVQGTLLAIQIN
jgi:hypothetical protein